MSNIILGSGPSGSGSLTLQAPNTNSNQTVNFPDASGIPMVSGNMPAFSASRTVSDQNISSTTWTKVQWNNELFDTANCYDTTNFRFTPNVAGYYLFTMNPLISASSSLGEMYIQFYKNGSGINQYSLFSVQGTGGTFNTMSPSLQSLLYMNGSTDYIESYIYVNASSPRMNSGGGVFNGILMRTA
jgi:hypothetical protein